MGGCGVQIGEEHKAAIEQIAAELNDLGAVLPGSLSERRLVCTHAGCHCHDDPPQLHGPYWYWTRKVAGKTVSKMLSSEQAEEYQVLIDNDRRLRSLVQQLERVGLSILEADPRTPRRR
jgi:hypothetical protein